MARFGADSVKEFRYWGKSVVCEIFWVQPKFLESSAAFALVHHYLDHHLRLVQPADETRLGGLGVEKFLVVRGEFFVEAVEQRFGNRLFRLFLCLAQVRVRGGHGDIHEGGFGEVVDEGHGNGLA